MDRVRVIVQIDKGYVNLFSDQEIDFITVDSKGNLTEPEEGVAGAFIGSPHGFVSIFDNFDDSWADYSEQIDNAQNPDPEDQRIEDAIDRAVEERR